MPRKPDQDLHIREYKLRFTDNAADLIDAPAVLLREWAMGELERLSVVLPSLPGRAENRSRA